VTVTPVAELAGKPRPLADLLIAASAQVASAVVACRDLFGDDVVVAQGLIRYVAPELPAHAQVQVFGEGLGQAVSQRLGHDGAVDVVLPFEFRHARIDADAGGDGEAADGVLHARSLRRDVVGRASSWGV